MRCGLGITFREDFGGKLHVHGLLPDGAGDRCGAVQVREPDGKRLGAGLLAHNLVVDGFSHRLGTF